MTVPDNIAPFFTMPLELRQQIYTEIFASTLQGSELLRTCREIKAQAHKFLFQRPVNFRSQSSLYEWLDRVPHELLQHVTEVSLSVQDVDLRALLQTDTSFQQTDTSPRLRSSELYGLELERLRRSLIQLPKVKKITIRALSSRQSFLYHDFLAKVLEMLSAVYPDLLEIRLEGNMHHQDLTFLANLRKLQSLSFDGFSSTSSTKTAGILASLEHLSRLSLISQHEMPTPGNHSHSGLRTKQQSFTGDVARTINQLATFSVTERIPTTSPPLFFTSEVLASLHNHKALKSLSISLSKTPDGETLESLRVFLKRSAIERLELDWPDLEPQLLEEFALIQSDLKILWVRAKNETDACDIISSISEKREIGDLQGLRQVVLIRSNVEYGNVVVGISNRKDSGTGETEGVMFNESSIACISSKEKIAQAKTRLQVLGVHVAWCTEDA